MKKYRMVKITRKYAVPATIADRAVHVVIGMWVVMVPCIYYYMKVNGMI